MLWLGTNDGMESRLVPRHGVDFEGLDFGSVRGKGVARLLLGPYAIINACRQAFAVLRRRAPGVVLGFGGFASFPGALMAAARNGSGRAEVYALVLTGTARRGAEWSPA